MIATKERTLTIENAQEVANEYVANALDSTYFTSDGDLREDGWHFIVQCHHKDMEWCPMVGYLLVCGDGQIEPLSEDQIREMKEAAEIHAAKERGESFARDENGLVLRRHARIKANAWTSNTIGMKIGAEGGMFINLERPIWRFSIHYYAAEGTSPALDVIDVDAESGQVSPLSQERIEVIAGGIGAARRIQEQTTEAVQ